VAFFASGPKMGEGTSKVHLPAVPVHCSIRLAYQAADASHPRRVEQARRRARKFRRIRSILNRQQAAEAPIGRALPGESISRSISNLARSSTESPTTTGRQRDGTCVKVPEISVCRAARLQVIVIDCVLSSAPLQIARSSRTIESPAVALPVQNWTGGRQG